MSQQYGDAVPPTQVLPPQRHAAPPAHARPPTGQQGRQEGGRPGGQPYGGSAGRRGTEPTAVAALITGLFGFVVPLLGILAIILGSIGLDRTRRRGSGGRGMAATGVTLGTIQVVFTAIIVIAGILFWNAYGDDIENGLEQAEQLTQTDLSLPDLLLGGLTGDVSLGDLQELAGTVGQADELRDLADQCQGGDGASCDDLLSSVPEDLLPDDVRDRLPSGN